VAIHVADAALVNVCGVAAVEVQTEKVWASPRERQIRILVVNRLDRDRPASRGRWSRSRRPSAAPRFPSSFRWARKDFTASSTWSG
jgi:hypothetical protein